MKLLQLLLFVCISVLVNARAFAETEPTIYSNDKSYWAPKVKIKPDYPRGALEDSTTGCVRMEFTINSDGKAVGPFKVVSIPQKAFEKVGLKAIKKASFIPSATNIDRTPIRSSIVYAFNLHTREKPEYFSLEQCEKLTTQ